MTGILSIPLACCYGGGALIGIAAIVTGYLGKKQSDEIGDNQSSQFGLVGLVLGIVSLVVAVALWVLLAIGLSMDDTYNY